MTLARFGRFVFHCMCFGVATATVLGAIGLPSLGYAGWALINVGIAAAYFPIFDLATGVRR